MEGRWLDTGQAAWCHGAAGVDGLTAVPATANGATGRGTNGNNTLDSAEKKQPSTSG